nr:hypothetical protein [Mycoplasmopsis cynos]
MLWNYVLNLWKLHLNTFLTDFEKISINIDQTNLIKGDEKSINIAAASILAKVYRDNLMIKIDKKYPLYDFKSHKGYLTKKA